MTLQTIKRDSEIYSHSVRQSVNALALDKVFGVCYIWVAVANCDQPSIEELHSEYILGQYEE